MPAAFMISLQIRTVGRDVRWITGHGFDPVARAQIDAYYKQDAATLELFLRVRRLDRAAKKLLRRDYDFILPGRVSR